MNLLLWGCKNWNGNKTYMEIMERFHTKSIQRIMKIKMEHVIEEKITNVKVRNTSATSTPLNKQYVNAN